MNKCVSKKSKNSSFTLPYTPLSPRIRGVSLDKIFAAVIKVSEYFDRKPV